MVEAVVLQLPYDKQVVGINRNGDNEDVINWNDESAPNHQQNLSWNGVNKLALNDHISNNYYNSIHQCGAGHF